MLKKKLLTDRSGELYQAQVDIAAKRLAEDIDAEIIRGMFKDNGWHEVVLDWIMTHEVSAEVDLWVMKNTKGKHWNCGLVWLFEKKQDATWFTLRWSQQYA